MKLCVTAVVLAGCHATGEDFDRRPVVKSVTAGPLLARFYASPTSEGGAATRFRVGEQIYLVNSLENTSHQRQICKTDYSVVETWGFPTPRVLRSEGEQIWPTKVTGNITWENPGPSEPTIDVSDLPDIEIAADLVTRKSVEVKQLKPLPPGNYEVEWRVPPADLDDFVLASHQSEAKQFLMLVCGYPLAITTVSIGISIEAAD